MRLIITGSLGHIGKPLTQELVKQGHLVSVITSKEEKKKDIEALGAEALVGSLDDVNFLITSYTGADAVFAMVPPDFTKVDQTEYYKTIAKNHFKAIKNAGVNRLVYLSSYGAHLNRGTGPILGAHEAEKVFDELKEVSVTYLRPGYFYYNLYAYTNVIKHANMIASNFGEDDKMILSHPTDIAMIAAEELVKTSGDKIVYLASDERSAQEIATALGSAIGKPDLKWNVASDEQVLQGMTGSGVPEAMALKIMEIGAGIHNGTLLGDYVKHRPTQFGKIKTEDFAKEFTERYNTLSTASHQ